LSMRSTQPARPGSRRPVPTARKPGRCEDDLPYLPSPHLSEDSRARPRPAP
jgi:hypothetical protein